MIVSQSLKLLFFSCWTSDSDSSTVALESSTVSSAPRNVPGVFQKPEKRIHFESPDDCPSSETSFVQADPVSGMSITLQSQFNL